MSETERNEHAVGFVTESRGYMCSIEGLPSVRVRDILETDTGARAMVTNLKDDLITATMLDNETVVPGDRFVVRTSGYLFHADERLFGRILNPVGVARDDIEEAIRRDGHDLELDRVAPGIDRRTHIIEQCLTGASVCDTLIPLGKGQRQLIYGPPKSGKRDFVQQTLINQYRQGTVCIYAICGRSPEEIRRLSNELLDEQHAPNTIIIAASSDDPSSLIAVTPSVAFAVAEVFVEQGRDVCLVLDDLGTHAKYLREIALLEQKLPGRESYPGDIFYQHAHLMERSGAFDSGGTLTLLPILENETESTRDLISTNLVASTDGNFAFSPDMHSAGVFPAIDLDDSITRAGRETQGQLQKQLATKLIQLLGWYKNQVTYSDFATISDSAVQKKSQQGAFLHELLKQERFTVIPPDIQTILLSLTFTSIATDVSIETMRSCKYTLINALETNTKFAALRESAYALEDLGTFLQQVERKTQLVKSICSQE